MTPHILFIGSSIYSARILRKLNKHFPVKLIITQPDKAVGRGKKIEPALIRLLGEELLIPVKQPKIFSFEGIHDLLVDYEIDLIVVAAFGRILSKEILEFPKYGCINVHASLLPRWRGASPIQSAIMNGDDFTGVTIMKMDEGIDTGAILADSSVKIEMDETSESLEKKLSFLGSDLLVETLPAYLDGSIVPIPQSCEGVSYAGLIKKSDGLLNFSEPGEILERKIRAFYPWPICFMSWDNLQLRVLTAKLSDEKNFDAFKHGIQFGFPCVGTATKDLLLIEVQLPGKKKIDGKSFLNGAKNWTKQGD